MDYVDIHCPHCKKETRIPFIPSPVQSQSPLSMRIEELPLHIRSYNALVHEAEINTVGQLVQLNKHELLRVRSLGRKSFNEIVQILKDMNLSLADCRCCAPSQ